MNNLFADLKSKSSIFAIILFTIILSIISSNLNFGGNHWKVILEADARGYYAYLPAIFIYHDLNFGFFEKLDKEKYYDKNLFYDYRSSSNGKAINKYYCGTALLELPFFFMAHYLSSLSHNELDGYSKLYPIFINIAAIFYALIGLIYLRATMLLYHIKEWNISLTLLAGVFGTNLFYYIVGEPGMSHTFSFGMIAMFVFYSKLYFTRFNKRHFMFMAVLLGLIILIRPINGIIIFALPFIAGSLPNLKTGILQLISKPIPLVIAAFICLSLISIQGIIYYLSSGSFFVDSYIGESFNFLSPHLFDILFSYKKGLFLYTPIYLLALYGCYFLWNSSKFEFFAISGFLILLTYIFSSWWCWYYGGSFSSRVYIEFLPLFLLLMALALNKFKSLLKKRVYSSLIVILVLLCQVQTFQYRYYEIHWAEMNKDKYWEVFLRIDRLMDKH